jgi:hypothetical protein
MTEINIHRVTYRTLDGAVEWQYRAATITDSDNATEAIRETADRQAAETDPALAFFSHTINEPMQEPAAVEPEEPTA